MFKSKQILVLGASGSIGKAVLAELIGNGFSDVQCFVRGNSEIATLKKIGEGLSYVHGDVLDRSSLKYAMKNADIVVNCTGTNPFWEPKKRMYREVNILGTKNIMDVALLTKVKKIIHVSSMWALGFSKERSIEVEYNIVPRMTKFARTKYLGDYISWELYKNNGLPLVVIYLAAVLNGENRYSLKKFVVKSPHKFMFIYITDAARAIVNAINIRNNIGQKYLVGSENYSPSDITKILDHKSNSSTPKRQTGKWLSLFLSGLMTFWSRFSKKSPLLPYDLVKSVFKGPIVFDGTVVEKVLGFNYTPIQS